MATAGGGGGGGFELCSLLAIFHDQSPRKYGTGLGLNPRPLDLQSVSHLSPDMLLTALCDPVHSKL